MHSQENIILNHQHRQSLLQEADRQRTAHRTHRSNHVMRPILAQIGRQMVELGQRLQEQSEPEIPARLAPKAK